MSLVQPEPFHLTGRHVLAGFMLFFTIVIGLDVLFASLAYRTFSGQAASNPYETGLLFNQSLARREAEARLGWKAVLRQQPNAVTLTFTGPDGGPLTDLSVTGGLVRPATETGRRSLAFKGSGGAYSASLGGLDGTWDLTAEASDSAGHRLEVSHRIILP